MEIEQATVGKWLAPEKFVVTPQGWTGAVGVSSSGIGLEVEGDVDLGGHEAE